MMLDEATWTFIDEHLKDDVRQLALKKSKYNGIDFEFALQQIQGRQKTRDKLPTLCAIPRFVFPPSLALEQCSSEETAKYKAHILTSRDDARHVYAEAKQNPACANVACHVRRSGAMADLTGGFGVDTLFLSALFETCHYVEPQPGLCDIMAYNCKLLQHDHVQIHQTTLEDFIQEMEEVEVIYADPSRRNVQGTRVVGLEDCSPNILQYKDLLLKKSRLVMLKLSPMLDIKRALAQLPETKEVHVVAVDGECKELLFLLDNTRTADVRFVAVNLKKEGCEELSFMAQEEATALPVYAKEMRKYLYEPNAAVLKAGAFKSIAVRYGLEKLHPHTHLYTADILLDTFPGRCFELERVLPVKEAMQLKDEIRKANVSIRNFPLSADELKKKLKLADGGEVYIFGTTVGKDSKAILLCKKV